MSVVHKRPPQLCDNTITWFKKKKKEDLIKIQEEDKQEKLTTTDAPIGLKTTKTKIDIGKLKQLLQTES